MGGTRRLSCSWGQTQRLACPSLLARGMASPLERTLAGRLRKEGSKRRNRSTGVSAAREPRLRRGPNRRGRTTSIVGTKVALCSFNEPAQCMTLQVEIRARISASVVAVGLKYDAPNKLQRSRVARKRTREIVERVVPGTGRHVCLSWSGCLRQ